MSITVKPVTPDFVAEISGLDLAQPLKPADRDAIEAAINRYAIVVFHDQKLTDEQQVDFARHFGPIHSSAQRASHTWKQGDLVIWDNRCTMHRARPFDTTKVRDLRRVTTRDVASTLEQAA